MLRLQRQSAGFVLAQSSLGALILLALAGYYLVIYRPIADENGELHQQLAEQQAQSAAPTTRPDSKSAPCEELQSLRQRLAQMGSVPDQPHLDEFLQEVHRLSLRWGLRGLAMQESTIKHFNGYVAQPISLAFQGDYQDAYSFILHLENLARLVRVKNLAIHSTDERQGLVSVNMDLDIYYTEAP
jgi:Tfp pilus assembly protein PilO